MSNLIENLTVIVRSAGEKTTQQCINQIKKEVDFSNIFLIQEKPFSAAVKKTFKLGIEQGKKWTLAVDADLLLFDGTIRTMLQNAEVYGNDLYVYQGFIVDWFMMNVRQGGPHLYLTQNLAKTEDYYSEMNDSLRPESFFYAIMREKGMRVKIDRKIYGLHDYYQNYKDIYRKAFFHGIKHDSWGHLLSSWLEKSAIEIGYKIVIKGFVDGFATSNKSYPTLESMTERFNVLQKNLDLPEESELPTFLNIQPDAMLKELKIDFYSDFSFERITGSMKNSLRRALLRVLRK